MIPLTAVPGVWIYSLEHGTVGEKQINLPDLKAGKTCGSASPISDNPENAIFEWKFCGIANETDFLIAGGKFKDSGNNWIHNSNCMKWFSENRM